MERPVSIHEIVHDAYRYRDTDKMVCDVCHHSIGRTLMQDIRMALHIVIAILCLIAISIPETIAQYVLPFYRDYLAFLNSFGIV